jgi:ABC-type nitrate/sulfonate/bicarbonate transport system ATPase subunit
MHAIPPLLDVQNLRLVLNRRVLCEGLSITVHENERVGLTGPSGCGKTTLLRGISKKRLPGDSTADRFHRTEQPIGYVPQDGGLCPWFDMQHNVDVVRPSSTDVQAWRARVTSVARSLDIEDVRHQFPNRLSGGEKQRWRLTRALAVMPSFLIVDEPLTEVPLELRWRVLHQWSADMAARRAGLLLVSHDIDVLVYMCDRIVILGGKPATAQALESITAPHPRLVRTFLTTERASQLRERLIVGAEV